MFGGRKRKINKRKKKEERGKKKEPLELVFEGIFFVKACCTWSESSRKFAAKEMRLVLNQIDRIFCKMIKIGLETKL